MRVFFFVDTFPKRSETFILQQITGLLDSGHDVRIIAYAQGGINETQPDVERYQLLDRLTIIPLIKNPFALAAKAVPFYAHRMTKLWCYPFSKFGLLMLAYAPYIYDADISHKDVVICNFGPNGIKAANMIRFGKDFKLITIFHGYDLSSFIKAEPGNIYKDVFELSTSILSISNFWIDKLVELGCDGSKIKLYRMGVDASKFSISEHIKRPSFDFVSTGRLVEKKGFAYAIEAFAMARPKMRRNTRYLIIGDGPLKQDLHQLIVKLDLEEHVLLLGTKDSSQVQEILQTSSAYIMPSVTAKNGDMEGIPVSLLEAQAMQLPVIATDHSGMKEGFEKDLSGLLVKESNIDQLADAMIIIASRSESDRKKMGKAGKAYVRKNYNSRKQQQLLSEIVDRL